jgi:hypothetical protein
MAFETFRTRFVLTFLVVAFWDYCVHLRYAVVGCNAYTLLSQKTLFIKFFEKARSLPSLLIRTHILVTVCQFWLGLPHV